MTPANSTTTEKLEAFKAYATESRNLSDKLVNAVIDQIGIDNDESLYTLSDIANHGVMGGYAGFTYHSDTIDFWNKNRLEIRKLLVTQAQDLGESMLCMIKSFNYLKDLDLSEDQIAECIYTDEETEDRTQILNALSWFAAEEVAWAYEDFKQESDNE